MLHTSIRYCLKYGSKRCKHSPTIRENTLHQAVMAVINSVVEEQGEFVQTFRENVIRVIADEIKDLKKKKAKTVRERQLADSYNQRLQDMDDYMKKTSYLKREFDDDRVRRLLQSVWVINGSKIEIQFKSGIVMTQRIDFED